MERRVGGEAEGTNAPKGRNIIAQGFSPGTGGGGVLPTLSLLFSANAWEDYLWWQEHDTDVLRRINALIREIQRTPFTCTGKPERLRHALTGYWSRRITAEHRIVYRVSADTVSIAQLRYHY